MDQILSLLPDIYANQLRDRDCCGLEEIRLAAGAPLLIRGHCSESFLWPCASSEQLEQLIRAACQQSIYAYTESICNGYLTIQNGHRIGICGTGVIKDHTISNLHHPTSLLIRIAHEIPGCAESLANRIDGSALILGPPGSGKTTLLRDLVRLLSDQGKYRIGLVDERGEVAACSDGLPQLKIGVRTDVLSNIPKATAIMMLLRTMAPQWIAMDEITSPDDISAIVQASFCGVHLLATAHGADIAQMQYRPLYLKLLEAHIFQYIITMKDDKSFIIEEVST